MSRGIASNRHHKKRLKDRRKNDIFYHEEFSLNKHIITPTLCSCVVCGNPRKYYGNSKSSKTIQELRFEQPEEE